MDPPRDDWEWWDCDIDTTRAGLERFARGLILCGGRMTSSFTLGKDLGRGVSAFTRIQLQRSKAEAFCEIVQPIDGLRRPPKAGTA